MTLPRDLLDQARFLLNRERTRPKQASLRRALSAAYYALFHLLIREGTNMLVGEKELRRLVSRAFEHGEMKQASRPFATRNLPDNLKGFGPVPDELATVANALIDLQEARHGADYDVGRMFTRFEVKSMIDQVEQAFHSWATVKHQLIARVYLAALLFARKWNR